MFVVGQFVVDHLVFRQDDESALLVLQKLDPPRLFFQEVDREVLFADRLPSILDHFALVTQYSGHGYED